MISRIGIALLLLLLGSDALACRCKQRTLAEYFEAATVVAMGQLHSVTDVDEFYRQFEFELVGHPFRGKDRSQGARLTVRTGLSSAACGVTPQPDATYIIFASADADGQLQMDTCSGSRIFRNNDGETFGFDDVPARFVVAQLQAQQGLDELRRSMRGEPKPNDVDNEILIGLLDIRAFSHSEDPLPLYASPAETSGVVTSVSSYEDLESRESGYEVEAAVVFAVINGWYKVRDTDGRFGWLPADAAGTFWDIATLIQKRLNYLTEDWNRMLWPDLGAGIPFRVAHDGAQPPREQAVRLLEVQTIGTSLWMRVEVLGNNECEDKPQTVLGQGWTPVYSGSGRPAIWYYSRGC